MRCEIRSVNGPAIVAAVQSGDASGLEDLYRVVQGYRIALRWRHVADTDSDDILQNVFLEMREVIAAGRVTEPEKLPGFIAIVVHRKWCEYIKERAWFRDRHSNVPVEKMFKLQGLESLPDATANVAEKMAALQRGLDCLRSVDREILQRFYFAGQSKDEIQEALQLSEKQFSLLKSRAKAKVVREVRRVLRPTVMKQAA